MNHMQILKRAWTILWSYKALWIFGVILAMTAASSGGSGSPGGSSSSSRNSGANPFNLPADNNFSQWLNQMERSFNTFSLGQTEMAIIGVIIGLLCLGLVVGIALRIARYVSQASLIRMVDGYETSGEKMTWTQGWRAGWSKAAWRLFLIDLLVYLPVVAVFIVLFGCAALPLILNSVGGQEPGIAAIVATVGLIFLAIFLLVVIIVALSLVMEIIYRVCVVQGAGVLESIRLGWQMVRRNLKDVFLMWLILIGVHIAYSFIALIALVVFGGAGLLAGGGVGLGLFFGVQALANMPAGIVAAVVLGGLLFLLILGLPLLFLGGLRETYFSTTWTLAFREINLRVAPAQEEGSGLPPALPEAPDEALPA